MNRPMNFTDLLTRTDAALQQALNNTGFQYTSPGTWNRRRGDELNIIWLQKHSSKESFCVNLGIHYSFLPKAGAEAPLDSETIDLPDCEVKLRLTTQATAK